MYKKNVHAWILLMALLCLQDIVSAQQKNKASEAANDYVLTMQKKVDSIKQAKQNGTATNKIKSNNNIYSRPSKYSTKKSTIESAYNFLTASEKDIVKNYPIVPEAFRTDEDAQSFLNKLKVVDLNADVQKYAKEKSIGLIGYTISYLSVKKNAEAIITEAAKQKLAFTKNNPGINFGVNVGKAYVGENDVVYLPLGNASFADEVVEAKYLSGNIQFAKENCLHMPDYIQMKNLKDNKGIYSLGLNGSIIIKFTNNALVDVQGPDLFVFEAGEIEPTNLDISTDGNTWIHVGKISGGTASVDINKYVKPNDYFYYVRLTDLNTTSTIAGADIDAVAAIGAALKLSLNAEVLFDVGKADLKPEGIDAVKKLAIQLQNMASAQLNIDGYTDDVGSDESNNKLSLQRANAVAVILKLALKNKNGFVYNQDGKGKTNPVVPNTNDENRKKNRRVEIVVIPK